ncbi:MAG: sulfite oxidase-like oxidoreductase [Dehalococcoidales bacterium]|jgi:DMSO/TMAO reductase YedYZ molybdopterin-dependent catalytic subunit
MSEIKKIVSPDTLRENRLPPGQRPTDKWPVLHHGKVHHIKPADWKLKISGLVARERVIPYSEFDVLPRVEVFADIHCVTTWSRYNNTWEGVSAATIAEMAEIKPGAKYVMVEGEGGFSTNLPLADFLQEDVLFAIKHDGQPISDEHGGPVRLVVPRLYFWKSAKWVTGVRFQAEDEPGFWERAGYHMHGDPWTEERYGGR